MTDPARTSALAFDSGGEGEKLLVLIHGLGANGRVWQPMVECSQWSGRWIAPDLRGHGGSTAGHTYAVENYATDIAEMISQHWSGHSITLLGHSLGGVVALALAAAPFGLRTAAVYGLGIKIGWTDEELAQMAALAQRQPKIFPNRADAVEFYGRQSGLGPIDLESPLALRSVRECEEGWRTALDPRAYAISRPQIDRLVREAQCPVHLARGAADPMVSDQQLLAIDADACSIAAAGHNAMVEQPEAVWNWLRPDA